MAADTQQDAEQHRGGESASRQTGDSAAESPATQESGADEPLGQAETLNRLAKILLAVVPALAVALTAVGSATGGLARLFRDQTGAARGAIALIFLSFGLAALATRTRGPSRGRRSAVGVQAGLLVLSIVLFIVGVAWAFDAQIVVIGHGQAPMVTGAVKPDSSGVTLDAHVVATGVRSTDRIVIFAFESSDDHGDRNSNKIPLYYSKSGPDADGRVDMTVTADVPDTHAAQYPYVFVTAVLGEEQRDCDGVLIEGTGPPSPNETACLTLQKPGAIPLPVPSPSPAQPQSAPARTIVVPGAASWTDSGVFLSLGQQFAVHATGQVSFIGGGPLVGPNGDSAPHPGVCVLPGPDHHAGLIGRVFGGAPFFIGDNYTGTAGQGGQLALGINDTGVDNNSGAFTATVQ